jgi:hypothetical protein
MRPVNSVYQRLGLFAGGGNVGCEFPPDCGSRFFYISGNQAASPRLYLTGRLFELHKYFPDLFQEILHDIFENQPINRDQGERRVIRLQ